jgi:hypothetical protein
LDDVAQFYGPKASKSNLRIVAKSLGNCKFNCGTGIPARFGGQTCLPLWGHQPNALSRLIIELMSQRPPLVEMQHRS